MKTIYLADSFYVRFVRTMAEKLKKNQLTYDRQDNIYSYLCPSIFRWRSVEFRPESLRG